MNAGKALRVWLQGADVPPVRGLTSTTSAQTHRNRKLNANNTEEDDLLEQKKSLQEGVFAGKGGRQRQAQFVGSGEQATIAALTLSGASGPS